MATTQDPKQATSIYRPLIAKQNRSGSRLDRRRSQVTRSVTSGSPSCTPAQRRHSDIDRSSMSRLSASQALTSAQHLQGSRICASCEGKDGKTFRVEDARLKSATDSTSNRRHSRSSSANGFQDDAHALQKATKHVDLALDACAVCEIGFTLPLMATEYGVMAVGAALGFCVGCAKTLLQLDEKKAFQGVQEAKKVAGNASYGMKASFRPSEYARQIGGNAIKRLEWSGRMARETGDKMAMALDPASTLLPEARYLEVHPMYRYSSPRSLRPEHWRVQTQAAS